MEILEWLGNNWGSILFWAVFAGLLALMAIASVRNMNHNYTAGSGMFKNSKWNLDDEKTKNVSDHNYYNDKGNMK